MKNLPSELINEILQYLSPQEIEICYISSRRFHVLKASVVKEIKKVLYEKKPDTIKKSREDFLKQIREYPLEIKKNFYLLSYYLTGEYEIRKTILKDEYNLMVKSIPIELKIILVRKKFDHDRYLLCRECLNDEDFEGGFCNICGKNMCGKCALDRGIEFYGKDIYDGCIGCCSICLDKGKARLCFECDKTPFESTFLYAVDDNTRYCQKCGEILCKSCYETTADQVRDDYDKYFEYGLCTKCSKPSDS